MFTFLRRIRKSFIYSGAITKSASPVGKYLLYAIGEITLVVIGILIALQINNRNEWRKERALEKIVLEDIEANIERNHQLIKDAIKTIDRINYSTGILNQAIKANTPFSDTLNYHIDQGSRSGTFLFKLNLDGYESLQSTGFNIIQNEMLKDEVLSLFEVTYGYVQTTLQFANSSYSSNWWKEYFYKTDMASMIPYDPEKILQNRRVITEILNIAFLRNDFQSSLKESLVPSQRVLEMIKEELRGADRNVDPPAR